MSNSPAESRGADLLGLALGERQRRPRGAGARKIAIASGISVAPAVGNDAIRSWPPRRPGDRRHLGLGRVQARDDPLGVLEQHLAGRREPHAARQPLDQRHPGLGLERGDLLRDGGLRVGERVGGGGERAAARDLDEDPQTVQI